MARSGIYKSEVQRARDALLAQGKHPSIDAVRVELGNTGSKTTISRYLKELEGEEAGLQGRAVAISEALQDLVARLAVRLHEEADSRIAEAAKRHEDRLAVQTAAMNELQQQVAKLEDQLKSVREVLQAEQANHGITREQRQTAILANSQLEQQVRDLHERLTENARHVASLDEKHQHARDALEHYRNSVKEQRDRDQRQYEQQLQHLQLENRQLRDGLIGKGEEVIHLNREAVRLASELQQLNEQRRRDEVTQTGLNKELEGLRQVARDHDVLNSKLQRCEQDVEQLASERDQYRSTISVLEGRLHGKDIEIAEARTRLVTLEQVATGQNEVAGRNL
ncbi:DNA-binding protein [Chitinolyticbacter albus]|uniref:DNA-binding protein n=1 Tax=Chitinolyticbacter albus TaxID=2961951 RepID=UPI00210EF3C8|nr:DNA-binding protein [Chitinolyticbacter albus]